MKKAEELINKHLDKLNANNIIGKDGNIYKGFLNAVNQALTIHVVSRQLKGLFVKKDEVLYCGYKVVISEICSKKWCIITDENDHHYNARIKDLRPRTF